MPLECIGIATVEVKVTIQDGCDPFHRVTDPVEGAEFRLTLYDLFTEKDVLDHFVYNCAANGIEDASRLDGWADLTPGMVTMEVMYVDVEQE